MTAICRWPTGTVYTGPRTCGKPAKAQTREPGTVDKLIPVCGIHARTARHWGDDVVPLDEEATR